MPDLRGAVARQAAKVAGYTEERWIRCSDGFGWASQDGKVFIERGAPMSGGGTAWLIWYRVADSEVDDDTVSDDDEIAYLRRGGIDPVRRGRVLSPSLDGSRWFVHGNDAGSLYEAKDTASKVVSEGTYNHG